MIDTAMVREALAQAPALPGLSAAWRDSAGELNTAVFGRVTPGGADLTPETVFQAGSVSKPVTAVGILRLVDQGVVDLDADINDILKSWKVPPVGDWQPVITLRRLLTHTAGLSVHGFGGYAADAAVPTVPQLLDGSPPSNSGAVRVVMMPGLIWKYSGGGTTIAQQAIVDATGTPFPELLHELVIAPCGMDQATFEQPLPERWHHLAATAHLADGSAVEGRWHTYPEMAAAGLWCAPKDLVAFAAAVQETVAAGPGALLPPDLARLLVTPAYPAVSDSMGVGFFLSGASQPDGVHQRFGHGGADHGFLTDLSADIAGRRAAAAMVHCYAGGPALRAAMRAAGRAIDWPDPPADDAAPAGVDQKELMAALADPFTTDDGRIFELKLSEGVLALIAPGQPALPLEMVTMLNWTTPVGLTVSFEIEDRRISGISIHQAGTTLKATRRS